jgi:GH24 family phage-related lysozyme (muramidase)
MAEQMPWEMYAGQASPTVVMNGPTAGPPSPPGNEVGPWNDYQPQQSTDRGALATGIQGFAQGITGNFADEIDAGLTAGKRALFNGKDFGTEYNSKLAYDRQMQGRDIAAHPYANLAGNVGGALALTPVLPGLTAETLPGQMAQAGLQGAGMGAVYGFGGGTGDLSDRLGNAAENAVIGGVTGAAVPAVVAGVGKAFGSAPEQITSADVKAMANQAYQKADELGGMLSPDATNTFLANASKNLKPQTAAGSIVLGDTAATKLADRMAALADKPLSLQAAQEIDSGLGDLVSQEYGLKGLSADGKKILDMQTAFRKTIEEATPDNGGIVGGKAGFEAWQQGKQLWSKQAQLRDIESIINRAQISEQPANAIRSGFKSLASNPTRMRGYDPDTRALIRQAAKTGIVGEGLRLLGSRLTSIGATGAGLATGGPVGAALFGGASYLTGIAARKAGEALATGKANQVIQSIAGDLAPAAESAVGTGAIQPAVNAVQGLTNAARGVEGNNTPAPSMPMPPPTYPTYNNVPPMAAAPLASQVIAMEEGRKPYSYKDTTGNRTVGVGFNMDQPNAPALWKRAGVTEPFNAVYNGTQPLSNASIDRLNAYMTQTAQKAAQRLVSGYDKLGENQKAALTSLALQLGGKEFSKFKALDYLKAGNSKAVENSLLNTKVAEQSPARIKRQALMLAYNLSHEQADRQLAAQGRIQPNQRKYI